MLQELERYDHLHIYEFNLRRKAIQHEKKKNIAGHLNQDNRVTSLRLSRCGQHRLITPNDSFELMFQTR